MESYTIAQQEYKILLTIESSKSASVFMTKHTGITITSMFIQGLFIQHLHKDVSTVVHMQPSLLVYL